MAVVGELEGLIRNHDLLISRGSILDAGKVKALISEYMSRNDMLSRLYKPIREKLDELLFCAETNFEKFQEVLNYKQITLLEYFYSEFFKEFSRDLNQSAQNKLSAGVPLYTGLLAASSLHTDSKLLLKVADIFLVKRDYPKVQRLFERLDETRRLVMSQNAEVGIVKPVPLIQDEDVATELGRSLFRAYSEETSRLEGPNSGFTFARNAYLLANMISSYLPEQHLIEDSNLVSTAALYFKELARRADIDSTAELVKFMEQFRANPATLNFQRENPDLFSTYMNSADLRETLSELIRNLLGKTRFDEARNLDTALGGIITFESIFLDHLESLKENRFYVQAIEMAEKMKLKDLVTDDLKIEALRTLMTDYTASPVKSNHKRLKNYCQRYGVNAQAFPQIASELTGQLEQIERANPEQTADLNQLYILFHIQRVKKVESGVSIFKLFEPIIMFFGWIFKTFLKVITGGRSAVPGAGKRPV